MIGPLNATDAAAVIVVVWIVAKEGASLVRWAIERRNGPRSNPSAGCPPELTKLLGKMVVLLEGHEKSLDRIENDVRAIPESNHRMVMEIVALLREPVRGGP